MREYPFPLRAHGVGRMTDKTSWTEPRRLMSLPVSMGIQSQV